MPLEEFNARTNAGWLVLGGHSELTFAEVGKADGLKNDEFPESINPISIKVSFDIEAVALLEELKLWLDAGLVLLLVIETKSFDGDGIVGEGEGK